jgi:ribonuclease HI
VVPIDGEGTNNIGELAAIRALLRAVPAQRPLEIVYDSEYARKCLTEWIGSWSRNGTLHPSAWRRGRTREPVKNAALIAETHALLAGRTVTWAKAKAHVAVRFGGHLLNHEADRLAGAAVATMRRGGIPDPGPGWTG